MKPILHFSRNPNPRLAVAAAKHLAVPVTYEFAAPRAPGQAEKFLPLNPSLRVPVRVEYGRSLWEADGGTLRLDWTPGG